MKSLQSYDRTGFNYALEKKELILKKIKHIHKPIYEI